MTAEKQALELQLEKLAIEEKELEGLSWQQDLAGAQPSATAIHSLHDQFMVNADNHANMFLAPASVPQGEKILRIVDFLKNIVPKESEQTLSNLGGSRLVISYGQQRPRLESVPLSQWVIANTRIFSQPSVCQQAPYRSRYS